MNLLTDPLFRVVTARGRQDMSLPGLMATLGRDEVDHLVAIQRHQEDAFHTFLCSLAAAILSRRNEADPVQSEDYWREGLRLLAAKPGDDAWTLVVDDLSRPAFMQPPLPSADHEKLKPIEPLASVPDALDLLATAKNHDVKQARAARPKADEWIYALISLQTMSGRYGRFNPGISRMENGDGNRPIVELVRRRSAGGRWYDAVIRLLDHRQEVLAGEYGYDPQGLVLVWSELWDGDTSLPLSQLDPLYVEICRRVRLIDGEGGISAASVGSTSNRIAAKKLKGVVGDAWLPVNLGASKGSNASQEKALTIPPHGLTPDIMRRLVFADGVRLTALQRPLASWQGPMWLTVSVLVRGRGITNGFHERHIPIPPRVQPRLFGTPARSEPLAALAKAAIDYAGRMQRYVLRPAIFVYLEGAPDNLQFDRGSAKAWWSRFARRFESLWSDDYFPYLWSVSELFVEVNVLTDWAMLLRDRALTVLREAEATLPEHQGRNWRTRIQAERVFWGALYNEENFPFLKEARHEPVAGT